MRIEVATVRTATTKEKGDLLEELAAELLRTQGYSVETEVRRTGSELDLLCTHDINGRRIYVECKAERDPLSANVLKNLMGAVTLYDYSEGWLISAGPLGKEAKGIQVEWEERPQHEREKLSIYTPERVVTALVTARVISRPPAAPQEVPSDPRISFGDWTLLITEYGEFWAQTVLTSGSPTAVRVFFARGGAAVSDSVLLQRLADTDSTLRTLDFECHSFRETAKPYRGEEEPHSVVQVEHGQSWSDYRPSRPKDFVGRKPAQDTILEFLDAVRTAQTTTRVFAITGDSGMGKSSLIAKLRSRTRNIRYRKKFFLYAVDVRAATKPSYVVEAVLACLRDAVGSGFIALDPPEGRLEISDHADPLSSASVQHVLAVAEQQRRVICLVFDQFEELYSKPEMFAVFEAAKGLFVSAASAQSNLVLGFAWRTDSTVQQDHPAYFMWHRLRDHRLEVSVGPLLHADVANAITIFQRELGERLQPGIRRHIAENSQGYPWLFKKLCIHLYDQLETGGSQARLVDTLDVERLFAGDLQALSQPESNCLRIIAAHAPADWHEVLAAAGADTLRGLQDKRLIVRSGDRINLYWDLFREYVLTGRAPSVPFTYVPSSSMGAVLAVATELHHDQGKSFEELGGVVGRMSSTVQNIVHDLVMFRVAQGADSQAVLDRDIPSGDHSAILSRIREVLTRHALYLMLRGTRANDEIVGVEDVMECLQRANPTAHHGAKTWKAYAERIAQWLCTAGLLESAEGRWMLRDRGHPDQAIAGRRRGKSGFVRRRGAFQAEAPPERVIGCLEWMWSGGERSALDVKAKGYRNAVVVLVRFGLVRRCGRAGEVVAEGSGGGAAEAVWREAWRDATLRLARKWVMEKPEISAVEVGERLAARGEEDWSGTSRVRVGNGVRRWARWLGQGEERGGVPRVPRGRGRRDGMGLSGQRPLFGE